MPAFAVDRTQFSYDPEGDFFKGFLVVGGIPYEGTVKSCDGNIDKAWANASKMFEHIEKHFTEIERTIREDFVPRIRNWTEEQAEAGYDDNRLAELIVQAIKSSAPVRFSVDAESISEVTYTGPNFLLGHEVTIQFSENGVFLGVVMSG